MDKKITIGIFNDSFFPMTDGVVIVVDNYARRLCKYANVIVFVPEEKNEKYDDSKFPYTVIRCKSIYFGNLDYSIPIPRLDINFEKEINKYNLDIVHIHSPFSMGLEGYLYAKKHKIPCVGTMHSQFKKDFQKFLKLEATSKMMNDLMVVNLFNRCDECWAVNSEVARIFYEDYACKIKPKVMNNATDMEVIKDKDKTNKEINKLHNLTDDTKVFLFVGRINTLKNILFIVDALKIVKEKAKFSFKMIFIGSGEDENKLKNKIKELNIEENVIMTGKITDRTVLAKYYARADLFLFPSLYDASSLVQIEAASQSTPTIFIKGCATAATATDGVNAFMTEFDIDKYADKIIEVMTNKKLYDKIATGAFNDLYKNWDDVVKDAYNRYLNLINNKKNE